MLFGFAEFVILLINVFFYLMVASSTYQYVKGQLYIYENHSTRRFEFTPPVKRRLKIILVFGFVPLLQYLLVLNLAWHGLVKVYKDIFTGVQRLRVMWRKLNRGVSYERRKKGT